MHKTKYKNYFLKYGFSEAISQIKHQNHSDQTNTNNTNQKSMEQ